MTRKNVTEQHETSRDEEHNQASGPARLVPKVTFGLGVAVLTGLAVVPITPRPAASAAEHAVVTTSLSPAINELGPFPWTTCCGQR